MKIKDNIAVKISGVSKKYVIHHDKPTLAERVLKGKGEEFYALRNISLKIYKGEKIGIIGSNGSGKTTLLKLITGIATPTKGNISTNGKVVSLIDLEAGFHPDLTGAQNIYLNGSIVGMSKSEIDSKISDIIEFADIGHFINAPLFTYSSGMALRLGFSVAIHSEPDILVLDEGFAVGDAKFRISSYKKIEQMIDDKKTIISASHDLLFIKQNCDRVIWLNHGVMFENGKTNSILKIYEQSFK